MHIVRQKYLDDLQIRMGNGLIKKLLLESAAVENLTCCSIFSIIILKIPSFFQKLIVMM